MGSPGKLIGAGRRVPAGTRELSGGRGCIPGWNVCVLGGGRLCPFGLCPQARAVLETCPPSLPKLVWRSLIPQGTPPSMGGIRAVAFPEDWCRAGTSTAGSAFGIGPRSAGFGGQGEEGTEALPGWAHRPGGSGGFMWIHMRQITASRVCVFTGKTCLSHNPCCCHEFLYEIWSFIP